MENENLTGRYVKSTIKRGYFNIEAQEPLKILSCEGDYCTIEKFGNCCNAKDTSNWQLMPKGWTPEQPSLSVNDLVKYGYYYTKDKNSDFWMLYRFKQINSNDEAFYTCCITKYKEFTKDDWFNLDYRITRKATAEEIQWLEICSKENKFIEFDKIKDYMNNSVNTFPKEQPKAYNYEVVHCKTQEEWNFVCSKIQNPPPKECFENCNADNSKGNCIDYNRHSNFCWKDYYVKRGDTLIYSFEEWCSKFNHKMPNNTPELSLLEQAKLKYPIGTKYVSSYGGNTAIVKRELEYVKKQDQITDGNGGSVYLRGKWAEIVQESPKLPIVGKVYDSIPEYPEYVECIKPGLSYDTHTQAEEYGCINYSRKCLEAGKIYKIFKEITINTNIPGYICELDSLHYLISKDGVKPSTYSEYLKQQNPITPEECINNDIIEVGDEVELVKHLGFKADSNHKYSKENLIIGNRYKVLSAPYNYSDTTTEKGIKVENGQDYCYPVECFKITKKANTQTTTINKKSDISSAIQVGNDVTVLDVFKSKQSKLMDYYAFIQQSPKELSKIKKNKFLTLTNN